MKSHAPSASNKAAHHIHFAEVIESSLDNFLAQSWKWDAFPTFGSLLQIEGPRYIILGTVTQIKTGSMDPMRYPFPYQKTEKELLREQPQIFEFLKTTFRVQIVGYNKKKTSNTSHTCYLLPPKPCKIHAFVAPAPPSRMKQFFSKPDFLHLLFAFENNIPNLDELLLAILQNLKEHDILTVERLDEFSKTFSLLSGNNYRRLKLFLNRAQTLL